MSLRPFSWVIRRHLLSLGMFRISCIGKQRRHFMTLSNSTNRAIFLTERNVNLIAVHHNYQVLGSKYKLSRVLWTNQLATSANNDFKEFEKRDDTAIPRKGLPQRAVELCPTKWQAYLRLSRIHRPIGTWLLFWPCTWGLALGAEGLPELSVLTLFGLGAFIMRGAGCTINDMWDRHIDSQVRRTSDRPLASGELRLRHAAVWLIFQLSLAFSILLQLHPPCFIIGVGALGLVTAYPLAKRVTNWPQVVLGMTFNTGIIMGYTAAQNVQLGYLDFPWVDPVLISLYVAGISWTLIYDTIYAYQDIEDDSTLGLGSTARRFGDDAKSWLTGFSALMISSLTTTGVLANLSWPYYVGIVGVASHLAWQIQTLDITNHKNCADRFDANRQIGWIIFGSILGSFALAKMNKNRSSVNSSEIVISSACNSSSTTAIIFDSPRTVDSNIHSTLPSNSLAFSTTSSPSCS